MKKLLITLAAIATVSAPLAASAGEVAHRINNQEHRIFDGVQDNQLNYREAQRLQRDENRIKDERQDFLHDGDGKDGLTKAQYQRLNRQENRLSRQIYRTKHDIGHH